MTGTPQTPSSLTALELMERQVRTLFRHDETGGLAAINEVTTETAPRLFVGRTSEGNIWRVRHDLPSSLVATLNEILVTEPITDDLQEPPVSFQCLLDALTTHSPVERIWQGPAWSFPNEIELPRGIETVIVSDIELLSATFGGTLESWVDCHPCLAVVEQGIPVAVCFCARSSAAASEAGVVTLPACRRRGYATAVTASWALAIRELGRIPLYSTSWDNFASQGVARRLGLNLYGVDLHFT